VLEVQQAIIVDGLILGVHEHKPFRVRYQIHSTNNFLLMNPNLSLS
jgi:hypothetical protein